jgi:hypothetical protein
MPARTGSITRAAVVDNPVAVAGDTFPMRWVRVRPSQATLCPAARVTSYNEDSKTPEEAAFDDDPGGGGDPGEHVEAQAEGEAEEE